MYYQGSTVVFLLNVMVMNDCLSIMKYPLFYYIECNCDVLLRIYCCIFIKCNGDE